MPPARLDPYAELGLAPTATRHQIADAYRRLAKRYHPDLHREPAAGERMRRINMAWEVLSDPARRSRHDADARSAAAFRTAVGRQGRGSRTTTAVSPVRRPAKWSTSPHSLCERNFAHRRSRSSLYAARPRTARFPSASSTVTSGRTWRLRHQAGSVVAQPFIASVTR